MHQDKKSRSKGGSLVARPLPERRVLLLSGKNEELVRGLVRTGLLAGWSIQEAFSLEYAVALQQRGPCDVVLIEGSLVEQRHLETWAGAISSWPTPVVVLADRAAAVVQTDAGSALQHWVPRSLVAGYPSLLEVMLHHAVQLSELQRELSWRTMVLQDCQRQVDRLVEMVSPSFLTEPSLSWFTQRHMMERLYEEVTRSQRHGDSLTLVLGEMIASPSQPIDTLDPAQLSNWTAAQVGRHKRRCDVGGQYGGPHGFMLLLPHTTDRGGINCCLRLRPLLENPPELPAGAQEPLQVRFGLASFSPEISSVKKLLGQAEERLERARGLVEDCLVV